MTPASPLKQNTKISNNIIKYSYYNYNFQIRTSTSTEDLKTKLDRRKGLINMRISPDKKLGTR